MLHSLHEAFEIQRVFGDGRCPDAHRWSRGPGTPSGVPSPRQWRCGDDFRRWCGCVPRRWRRRRRRWRIRGGVVDDLIQVEDCAGLGSLCTGSRTSGRCPQPAPIRPVRWGDSARGHCRWSSGREPLAAGRPAVESVQGPVASGRRSGLRSRVGGGARQSHPVFPCPGSTKSRRNQKRPPLVGSSSGFPGTRD